MGWKRVHSGEIHPGVERHFRSPELDDAMARSEVLGGRRKVSGLKAGFAISLKEALARGNGRPNFESDFLNFSDKHELKLNEGDIAAANSVERKGTYRETDEIDGDLQIPFRVVHPRIPVSGSEMLQALAPCTYMNPCHKSSYWNVRGKGYKSVRKYSVRADCFSVDYTATHTTPTLAELVALTRQFEVDVPVVLCANPLRVDLSHNVLDKKHNLFTPVAINGKIIFICLSHEAYRGFKWSPEYRWLIRDPEYHPGYEKKALANIESTKEAERKKLEDAEKKSELQRKAILNLKELCELKLAFMLPSAGPVEEVKEDAAKFNNDPVFGEAELKSDEIQRGGHSLSIIRYESEVDFPTAVQDLVSLSDYDPAEMADLLKLLKEYSLAGERIVLLRGYHAGQHKLEYAMFENGRISFVPVQAKENRAFSAGTVFLVRRREIRPTGQPF